MRISIRSLLVAGLSITAASTSVSGPIGGSPAGVSAAPAYRLAAAVSPLLPPVDTAAAAEYAPAATAATAPVPSVAAGPAVTSAGDFIINAYNALEPWAAWGAELIQWGMGFVPLLWWFAPGVSVAYFTAEPVVQSLVYSFAYLIDGNFSLIGPTIQAGLQEAAQNFVQYSIYWFESLIPFPPLPPWPPFPGAATAAVGPARATRAAAAVETNPAAGTDAAPVATPADTAAATAADTAVTPPKPRVTKRSAANTRTAPAAAAAQTDSGTGPETGAATGGTDTPDKNVPAHRTGKAGAVTARSGR